MLQNQCQLVEFLVFGQSYIGKTSFLKSAKGEKFDENYYPNTGIELIIKQIKIRDEIQKLYLWEFPGFSNFKQIARRYYKRAQGLILLYDITDHESFINLENYLEEAIQHHDSLLSIILIGNKVDLDSKRQVSIEEAEDFAQKKGFPFFEISAKTNHNIDLVLEYCLSDVLEKAKIKGIELKKIHIDNEEPESQTSNSVSLNQQKKNWFKCY
ncbi:unnamed protein product (macronuclear) [Paramecium tetraurelia]|uniref:Chromosome undetermined scaffold_115, whole genome shotgun sequence n=1 Tax=Paramecium tetraurelia TaxID=5888 RepID=Q3SDP7_PARTE|nr:uncharacterized protein GSPATT00030229001 [Paramecium tetraurelia]CAI39311.1 rab_C27 [Paramecium tetraurelia]CAK59595.1 unnamed protein product [Paramecium tetraurelia]|eukprot:XP_001426993.1 hypothetical protein (macronuclear) [Paramecium tetraurelia strain d4-2]